MPSWADLTTVTTVVAFLAAAIDFVVLRQEKVAVHRQLAGWWKRIDQTKVPDIPARMADRVVGRTRWISHRRPTWRSVLLVIGISWLLTTIAGNLGIFLGGYSAVPGYGYGLYPFEVYLLNLVFDAATVGVGLALLRRMARSRSVKAIAYGSLNLVAALGLAMACAVSTDWYSNAATDLKLPHWGRAIAYEQAWSVSFFKSRTPENQWRDATEILVQPLRRSIPERVAWIVESATYRSLGRNCCHEIALTATITQAGRRSSIVVRGPSTALGLEGFLFASTTLIPTVILIALILLGIAAKAVLGLSRGLSMRVLSAAIEIDPAKEPRDFMPATLLAILLSSFAFLAKAAVEAARAIL